MMSNTNSIPATKISRRNSNPNVNRQELRIINKQEQVLQRPVTADLKEEPAVLNSFRPSEESKRRPRAHRELQ